MSWSISVESGTAPEATAKAIEAFCGQTGGQRGHDCDRGAIIKAIGGAVAALGKPDEGQKVVVTGYGSTSGVYPDGMTPSSITSVEFTIKAAIT